jgi:molybdenum cofactor cytidylyltransferase
MDLITAFNLDTTESSQLVAIVGGGGKSSLMFALAEALPGRVVTTTTTRVFAAQMKLAPAVCYADDLSLLGDYLAQFGTALVVGAVGAGKDREKALGVPPELPGQLLARSDVDFVLVEADGSRMRPIKAPAAHEPVIPPETTLVVPAMGIDALDGRIADMAHRPERVVSLIHHAASVNDRLTAEDAALLLTHSQGGMKGVPDGAQVIPLINKVETPEQLATARQIAHHILRMTHDASRIPQVVIASLKSDPPIREVQRRVTAVVLAAGQSKRMGQTKQLLPWRDTTVLGQVLRNLKQTAVHDILVVSGHEAENVQAVAEAEAIATIFNPRYAVGEMISSLQTAVAQLPDSVMAVLVMLADQPTVTPQTIDQLLIAYWQGKGSLIAPAFEGRRGNPVLIGREHFVELLALPHDSAPRQLLRQHEAALHLVSVPSDAVLRDLDTLEEYQLLLHSGRRLVTPGSKK